MEPNQSLISTMGPIDYSTNYCQIVHRSNGYDYDLGEGLSSV